MNRLKVAVVHPRLGAGGSEARAVWTLQALRAGFDVSLISCGPVHLDRLNGLYGTKLAPTDFRHRRVPLPPGITGHRFTALQGHILQRYCRRAAAEFDVMISTYNPMSFGVPAIQCIADFSFVPELLLTINPVYREHGNWWYGDSILRRSYLGLCNLVSRTDSDAFKHDLIVANSQWSRDLMRQKFGLESRLLYPAVVADFPEVPFTQRDNGFVCMGRAVATKRMDAVIRILEKVRKKGHDVHLHILSDIDDSPYAQELKMLADERPDWVFLEGLTFGDAKRDLLVRHRYGINGCLNEAFGISVAEMVRAGCLVFVPDGGGQREIVNQPGLIYENDEDAVHKIDAVLRDAEMGNRLADHLRVWAQQFSTRAFKDGILAITREFIVTHQHAGVGHQRGAISSQPSPDRDAQPPELRARSAAPSPRPKVAVVHPLVGVGGSEARALWALQALRAEFDVTLITCGPVDLNRLNTFYGTSLSPEDFRHMRIPFPLGIFAHRFTALGGHLLDRFCQRVASSFDVMVSAYNPRNFGVPGIQCIADFSFVPTLLFPLHPVLRTRRTWWYGDSILRRTYLGFCNLISRYDPDAFKRDLIVANSEWSRELMRQTFGLESRLLYPAVANDYPAVPFGDRHDGFVCIGRVVPEKRMDAVIRVLGKVRQRGHDVHLHILGGLDDSLYAQELKQLAEENRDWVHLEGLTFGRRKTDLLVGHRYGINASLNEPFGIAVAEMVNAGCIAFVPNGGGQKEIVNHPGLTYQDDEDAVNKIDAVLRDRRMQRELAEHLAGDAQRLFSTEVFSAGIAEIVREFLARKHAIADTARAPAGEVND